LDEVVLFETLQEQMPMACVPFADVISRVFWRGEVHVFSRFIT
jgi:hypothetical protein